MRLIINPAGARRWVTVVAALVSGLSVGGALVSAPAYAEPAVALAEGQQCWSATESHDMKPWYGITFASWSVKFHWCATNGRVDSFVVDKAYAVAKEGAHDATIDIQPYRPLEWGPTYDIYIDVKASKNVSAGTFGAEGNTIDVKSGDVEDRWDITLHSNGSYDGDINKSR